MNRGAFEAAMRKLGRTDEDLRVQPDGSYFMAGSRADWAVWCARDAEIDALQARVLDLGRELFERRG